MGAIIRGGRLFQIFSLKGDDYLREAINRGTAIIRGNTIPCDIILYSWAFIVKCESDPMLSGANTKYKKKKEK